MKITKLKTKGAEVEISKTELFALRQIFNEVCHGIRIANFKETIGIPKVEAKQVLNYFDDLEKRTAPGTLIVHKVTKRRVNKSGQEEIRKSTRLKSEKYDLCFYMKKSPSAEAEISLAISLQKTDTSETIVRTDRDEILIKKLHQETALLKEGIDLFNEWTNTHTSYSFLNEAVKINLGTPESNNFESELTIEFVFKPRRQDDVSAIPKSFTSTASIDNIIRFAASIEDFLSSIK